MHCVFCETPDIKTRTVAENDLAWSFPTNIPIVPGHLLICPKRCVASVDELTDEEIAAISEIRKRLKTAMKKVFGAEGFNYAWNESKAAGQSVPHLHLHMLPRKEGDEGIYEYNPRKFLYRPGSRETSPESELNSVAELVREAL